MTLPLAPDSAVAEHPIESPRKPTYRLVSRCRDAIHEVFKHSILICEHDLQVMFQYVVSDNDVMEKQFRYTEQYRNVFSCALDYILEVNNSDAQKPYDGKSLYLNCPSTYNIMDLVMGLIQPAYTAVRCSTLQSVTI